MKTCPVCALTLEDAYLSCPDDGSSLGTLPSGASESGSASAAESNHDTVSPVVLYCPACAAEYPLTFSTCPVHGVQLTKHRIPRLLNCGRDLRTHDAAADAQATVSGVQFQRDQSNLTKRLTILDLKRPLIESPRRLAAIKAGGDDAEFAQSAADTAHASAPFDSLAPVPVGAFASDATAFGYHGPLTDAHEQGFERPGFRVAAIATIIALVVFGLVATYTFVSSAPRRPSSPAVQVASKTQAAPQPLPFVATPQEAQEYKEEAPVPTVSTSPEPKPEQPAARARNESPLSSPTEHGLRKTTVDQPLPKPPAKTTPPAPVTTTRVSNPPMPALPRGNSGGFDARLIRVRSRKTAAGFRYDLTFNMQEQAGRSAQWQRVLISTRSASGMNHSEAIPFSHRLGAAGALTFTISVELTGRSESDWQGRIVCTTLGWDNNGAPLQASFGANVTP
jgi:outer membrane biosynthesis protein TonB